MKRFFVLLTTFVVVLTGCFDSVEILKHNDNNLTWKQTPELDIFIDLDSIDWEKYNERFTIGYNHRRWDKYIKPALWHTKSVGDYIYIPDGHGANIYKFDLQGKFVGKVAERPSLSNRRPTRDPAKNYNRKPITDGIVSIAIGPDESNINALIVWSPMDLSRPHYVNLISWHNGELTGSGFGMGNAYEHWEPADDNGYPDPIWNNATHRLGSMFYVGDNLMFLKDNEIFNKRDETLITLDVIPETGASVFIAEGYLYTGDVKHQVFSLLDGKLVGTIDLENIVDGDNIVQGYVRVPFYNHKHKTLYAYNVWTESFIAFQLR